MARSLPSPPEACGPGVGMPCEEPSPLDPGIDGVGTDGDEDGRGDDGDRLVGDGGDGIDGGLASPVRPLVRVWFELKQPTSTKGTSAAASNRLARADTVERSVLVAEFFMSATLWGRLTAF